MQYKPASVFNLYAMRNDKKIYNNNTFNIGVISCFGAGQDE